MLVVPQAIFVLINLLSSLNVSHPHPILSLVPCSVPSSLLIQEPGVAGPEEAVEKPEQDGGIACSKPSCSNVLAVSNQRVGEVLPVGFLARRTCFIDPRLHAGNSLDGEQSMSPS